MAFHCRICDFQSHNRMVMREHYKRAGRMHDVIKTMRSYNAKKYKKIMRMKIPLKTRRMLIERNIKRSINIAGKTYEI